MKTLKTYTKGTQQVHIMQGEIRLYVVHENKEGLSQCPVMYDDYTVAYDHPERVNKGIKKYIERAFHARNMIQFARKYDGLHGIAKRDKYTLSIARELARDGLIIFHEDTLQFERVTS